MRRGHLWGLFHLGKGGFLKGPRFITKGEALRAIRLLTCRRRDPITNYFRSNVIPRAIPAGKIKKIVPNEPKG